jgi:hypothetical protein
VLEIVFKPCSARFQQVSEKSPTSVRTVSNKYRQVFKTCVQQVPETYQKHIQHMSKYVKHMSNTDPTSVQPISTNVQKYPNSVQQVSKQYLTSLPKVSQTNPTSVSKVHLQFADAYLLYVFWI